MNNKRTLVIAAVAVLAVILSVGASLVFPRSASSAQLIPVTGLSKSGASANNSSFKNTGEASVKEYILSQQNKAADNSSFTNIGESPEEEYILSQQNKAADNSSFTNTGESPEEEHILSQQNQAANNSSVTKTGESPEEEYILSQQNHAANNSSVTNTGESPQEEYILSQQNLAADNSNVLSVPKTFSAPAASQSSLQVTGEFCPFTVQELQSLHPVDFKEINVRMLETSDGPIGYDGGTFSLGQCRISK
jgi:hypothetical protein